MSSQLDFYLNSSESENNLSSLSENEQKILKQFSPQNLLKVIVQLNSGAKLEDILKPFQEAAAQTTETGLSLEAKDIDLDEGTSLQHANDSYFVHLSKYTPLRLSYEERSFLRLLDSCLKVSEYTDKIDIYHDGSKARKIAYEIKQVCSILSGLVVAHNYDGQRLIRDRDYESNAEFFRTIFEIGRRYKVLNPDRMRNSYGKLIYFLMDSRKPEIQELLNFDCVMKVRTVYDLLETKKNGLALLSDPLLKTATMEIIDNGKTKSQIKSEIQAKEAAVRHILDKYSTGVKKSGGFMGLGSFFFGRESESMDMDNSDKLTRTELETCLYSLSDHHAHLRAFRDPCDEMINLLKENFSPKDINPKYSLSISAGYKGARLTHNHSKQYCYVLESLTLWREIAYNMFALWHFAELDLLDSYNPYRLRDTGQGLNRVQDGPNVIKAMRKILVKVQQEIGEWIGSNVIHLGDHNVPNSLWFIDKYTQIPRILVPIVSCIKKIPELYSSTSSMKHYIDSEFDGPNNLKMLILSDFFCHAFDGSGADNFNDAGSCIDGRLTSAWNWCSMIEKKKFFPIFLLTNFSGFDGRFEDA